MNVLQGTHIDKTQKRQGGYKTKTVVSITTRAHLLFGNI